MRIEQLQYIIEVAKHRSITKAAKQLFIAQPSLSSAIAHLEQELGIKIFLRTPEGVEATELGQIVLEKTQRILGEIEDLANISADVGQNLKGTVAISTLPAMTHILLEVLYLFKEKYPLVNIPIREDDNTGIIRALRAGDIDLGLIATTNGESDQTFLKSLDGLRYEKLFTDEICLYVAPEHDLLKVRSEVACSTQSYPLITFKNNFSVAEIEHSIDFKYSYILRFSDSESMKKMVARGSAVGLLARIAFLNDLYVTSGKIVPIVLPGAENKVDIGIVFRKDYVPLALKKYIVTLKDVIATILTDYSPLEYDPTSNNP